MAKRMKFDESGDSEDLQALFDSIAAQPAKPRLEVVSEPDPNADSGDLQALFDTVADEYRNAAPGAVADAPPVLALRAGPRCAPIPCAPEPVHAVAAVAPAAAAAPGAPVADEVFRRVGHMARQLHDTLRELGYDRMLEETARAIPDARQRLAYIAQMTEQAASRALNAIDIARPLQERLQGEAEGLAARWQELYADRLSIDEFKALAADTRVFLTRLPEDTRATNGQLLEIMMAQDFQDLTGQVIKTVVDMSQSLETQLLQLLVEVTPAGKRDSAASLLNGPVIGAAGRSDVVSDQGQVDELLESLGF